MRRTRDGGGLDNSSSINTPAAADNTHNKSSAGTSGTARVRGWEWKKDQSSLHHPSTASTLSGWDLYTVHGDASAAWSSVTSTVPSALDERQEQSSMSLAATYNSLWLSQLITRKASSQSDDDGNGPHFPVPETLDSFYEKLAELEASILSRENPSAEIEATSKRKANMSTLSSRRLGRSKRNASILAYNRALTEFALGDISTAATLCAEHLAPLVQQRRLNNNPGGKSATTVAANVNDISLIASCRLAMLYLECILAISVGKNLGVNHHLLFSTTTAPLTSERDPMSNSNQSIGADVQALTVESVVAWLEYVITQFRTTSGSSNSGGSGNGNDISNNLPHTTSTGAASTTNDDVASTAAVENQLKFLLPVYKSRLALSEFENGKRIEACVRSARKDMKTAMEVFQNKLRPVYHGGGSGSSASSTALEVSSTGSVVSLANSEEGAAAAASRHQPHPADKVPTTQSYSIVLQRLNQSALSVKAHLEQLKGNTKKSLVLCSEALSATTTTTSDKDESNYYEPMNGNNLGVVYGTNNRRFLALHALVKALQATNKKSNDTTDHVGEEDAKTEGDPVASSAHRASVNMPSSVTIRSLFHADGTARPNPTLSILYNTALCALRARQYIAAYECLATCLSQPKSTGQIFVHRLYCWLRLAEACIGISTTTALTDETINVGEGNDLNTDTQSYSAIFDEDGEPQGIVINDSLFHHNGRFVREELCASLGSVEDMQQVKRNPLLRACYALQYVVQSRSDDANQQKVESDDYNAACLSLSYIYLVMGEYHKALDTAKIVIESMKSVVAKDIADNQSDFMRRLHRRQAATARFYAAEACSALSQLTEAMSYLLGGEGPMTDDGLDHLALDLSGITVETASTNAAAKAKLLRAQTMVSSSAAVITAAMGNNHRMAKQLALSANAIEGDSMYGPHLERQSSAARRALIYTLLCEGNHASALTTILSLK